MIFSTNEEEYKRLLKEKRLLKSNSCNGRFVDAWFSERHEENNEIEIGGIRLSVTPNGIFGILVLQDISMSEIEETVKNAYVKILQTLLLYPNFTPIRFWNFVPHITEIYQPFNSGRYKAFQAHYGFSFDKKIPAASAVGVDGEALTIEFLAVEQPISFLENKNQIPAYQYSRQYGERPPFFSRGIIYNNNGQRLLLSSGTASVVGEDSTALNDIYEQLLQSFQNLRILGSQFNLKHYEIHYGFALEDIAFLRVYYKRGEDLHFLKRFVPKFLSPGCQISFHRADICRKELLVELEGVFVKKGESEYVQKPKYTLDKNGKIPLESFEVHIAEHCNLKCRDCCNISPFNPKKFIQLDEMRDICSFVDAHFLPDVFKVAGGEPTLHPQLDEILSTIKQSGLKSAVRVISNGLLMHKMSEKFWQGIDQLTISHYKSAPLRPSIVALIKDKARQYEVVLNIKYVEQFNEIFVEEMIDDKIRIQSIYEDCWMRHRCLIIRNGRFYKCTRAAYMDNFLKLRGKSIQKGPSSYSQEDGILLTDPEFNNNTLKYLNSKTPLHSCEYCLGVSGNLRENVQLRIVKDHPVCGV